MNTVSLVVGIAVCAALLAFTLGALLTPSGRPRQRVVVTTSAGDSFRGEARPRLFCVRLEHAEALRASGQSVELGGRLDVPRRSIVLVQRLPAPVEASERLRAVS